MSFNILTVVPEASLPAPGLPPSEIDSLGTDTNPARLTKANGYTSLEQITEPVSGLALADEGKCVGRRANMVGVYEQLQNCGRVYDLQGKYRVGDLIRSGKLKMRHLIKYGAILWKDGEKPTMTEIARRAGFTGPRREHREAPWIFAWWLGIDSDSLRGREWSRVTLTDDFQRTRYHDAKWETAAQSALYTARQMLRIEPQLWIEL